MKYTFLYHDVCDEPNISGFSRLGALPYKHTWRLFSENIESMLDSGISFSDLSDINFESNEILLTFDDGGGSFIDIAKYLYDKGIVAFFFITTSMIGKKGFVTISDICEIHKMGHVIGTHSHSHPAIFRDLSDDDQFKEWRISIDILSNILNKEIIHASIPGGDIDSNVYKICVDCGLRFIFNSEPDLKIRLYKGAYIIGRLSCKNTTSTRQIGRWLNGKGIFLIKFTRLIKNLLRKRFSNLYRLSIAIRRAF